ncbi:MAG: DUF378 domain-containing protein [bacterium]|nr:DUF378 domain-containing protein [bacterium]
MKGLHIITFILLIVGGLNWGVFALTGWDLGQVFPGGMTGTIAKVVYVLVGLSALVEILTHKKSCMACKSSSMEGASTGPAM